MSVQAMSWVIENAEAGGSELLILILLANAAHADGTHAYPGRKRLAREARMSERQVVRICKRLVEQGLIRHEGRSYLGTNEYAIVGLEAVRDKLTPPTRNGGDTEAAGGDIRAPMGDIPGSGGDIAMSANPSVDPSTNPSNKPAARAQGPFGASAPRDVAAIKEQVESNLRIANDPKAYPPARKAARKLLKEWGIEHDAAPVEVAT